MKEKQENFATLYTPFESADCETWSTYPRPQMKRESYISLCGKWELLSKADNKETPLGEITVPFVPESRISGIFRKKKKGERYIYKKEITVPEGFDRGRVLIHFGAVDQICKVLVNGKCAGEHTGGYLPFSFEIGQLLAFGENTITVEVTDELDLELAYGKQREKRGGMWYTPISGIWQTPWLESVPKEYISSLKIDPTLNSVTIHTEGGEAEKILEIKTADGIVSRSYSGNTVTVEIDFPKLWSPEEPYLYEFSLTAGEDRIESYFALRTVTVEKRNGKPLICLNGKPFFFHGVLDQGYFADGIYLPASPEGYKWDILTMKRLGFNMLRKHIKIEPELFYYYCDKYGMIVFQDMVNSGKYSYIRDTVMPTIGFRKKPLVRALERCRSAFLEDCKKSAELLYNHPCVCYYTIFNEGWGQHDADRIYREMKALDPTRIWDSTSGWFFEKESDVQSEHVYFKKIRLKKNSEKPLVLSEFGGYSYREEGHCFNLQKNYGYKLFKSAEALTKGISELYLDEIVPEIERSGLCAAVLTQLSDVEDETNGLCTYDRQVVKVDEKVMQNVSKKLSEAFKTINT